MKCVRVVGQGIPVRMSNEDAFQIVDRDRDGEYCPKDFWRRWYDEQGENGLPRQFARIGTTGITKGAVTPYVPS